MRKLFFALSILMLGLLVYSCTEKDNPQYELSKVKIQLVYPEGYNASEGVEVSLKNTSTGSVFTEKSSAEGAALFEVPKGIYEASASEQRVVDAEVYLFNGVNSNVNASAENVEVVINLELSKGGSVVIKELYVGGCQKDDGSGDMAFDKYVILYNNSVSDINVSDYVLAVVNPHNSQANNRDYNENGELFYASEGWIPAGVALWYFETEVIIKAYSQIVIALNAAVNHTVSYSNSINFANKDYYCLYDIEDFYNQYYHPAPSELIPVEHYLKAYKLGKGNGFTPSKTSPALFIFKPRNVKLKDFYDDPNTTNLYALGDAPRKKVPVEWIVDGIEVFQAKASVNYKRLLPSVDAGYIEMTDALGYTLYRNVDKEATEAIKENEGKLVYNYSLGVEGSTDPSGIDAEASIKNGARIVYKDTNNSSVDFHQRSKASLRN